MPCLRTNIMQILSVSQVNTYIKALLDEIPHIKNIYISGEISNFKHYPSGHMYFTLKDEKSQIKSVFFSSDNYKIKFKPENGMKVICFGQVGVYERDGVYQLYCRDMQPQGIGSLTIAYEQLKSKLEQEGLFDASAKKTIPLFPQKIGVATSNMGAAVEDIKNVISRRYPLCEIIIMSTIVQGDNAAPDIVKSIQQLDKMQLDVIIVGRGGGSIEDLWAFNTESVARAVYNCNTPIISAVGHETDFTICDFVADLRAPTPSAAAELAVPDINNEKIRIQNYCSVLDSSISSKIEQAQSKLEIIVGNPVLKNIDAFFIAQNDIVNQKRERLLLSYSQVLASAQDKLKGMAATLNALSPLNVLARGYSIASCDNKIVKSIEDIAADDNIDIRVSDGVIHAKVLEVKANG